ncbi:MAG TPA: ribonuclease P protein component [Candidatus Moranbacteria bacterium]|nr:ribonuclease P protein component [Candidatus Moranbacteria bacterium]HAT75117.1 ribonuclease P protein component [Candidatus Moranbacteria bacterium]
MLLKKNRIKKNADFESVYRFGKAFFCGKIAIKAKENGLAVLRVGVSVGLNFSKKSVDRNRIKRQIRAFFRQNLEKIKTGWDIVAIVQKGWDKKVNPRKEFAEILVKNGLLKG